MSCLPREPRSSAVTHARRKLTRRQVLDAYSYGLARAHLEPDFAPVNLTWRISTGASEENTTCARRVYTSAARRMERVVVRSGHVILLDTGGCYRLEVSKAEPVPGVGVDQFLDRKSAISAPQV